MESYLYDDLYALEDSHWWHRAKRQYVKKLIDAHNLVKHPKIVDIGCGTGKNVEVYQDFGDAYGIDMEPAAIAYCKKRGLKHVSVGLAQKTGLDKNSIDIITLLDVLEHTDESEVLNEMYRILKKKGILIITVPALSWLWSQWDVVLHHKRRYNKKRLQSLLQRRGFTVSYISYVYAFLVIPALVIRFIKQHITKGSVYASDFRLSTPLVNTILYFVSVIEQRVAHAGIPIPLGTSIVCLCKKSPDV